MILLYPWAPPEAPISAVNVVPFIAVIRLGVNPAQLVQRGAVVHSSTPSRVRSSGCVEAREMKVCQLCQLQAPSILTSRSGKMLKCSGTSWSQSPDNVSVL